MSSYFVLQIENLDDAGEEWVSAHAFDWGALGASERLEFDQPEGEEDVFMRHGGPRAMDVYFEQPPGGEFVETLKSRFPEARVSNRNEQDKDWLAEWKKGFKPFALAGGHWVGPSCRQPPASARHKIWIDPGMAFGTGTHETTQLVARALVDLKTENEIGSSLLDVGTGTGILAILGRQLGVERIDATEIEADSRRVARENFALNGCADIRMDERQLEDLKEKYDVVVANIIDGVLVRIQDALKARVKPGGWLILSGIIAERDPDFLSGFKVTKEWDIREAQGDWRLYGIKL
ncbi:MAG TPA: 50S ribosomal protein L11 methyltransferase [Bdellovibrionales bacterium]|nr:50S ribosomal protein L11 methyltransferase [Bdellovibrionales bacterium]